VECQLRVQTELPSLSVSAEWRHNLFLAFEESLSNVLKHAQASRVEVLITFEQGCLQIRVRDNGIGFTPTVGNAGSSGGKRNGLKNMLQRLADVRGECQVESQPGQGATVEFRVPFINT
jgi:signal transduction histidine kinase